MTPFYKFHGTGNDFIMIDGFTFKPILSASKIQEACDRHFGIGADGLIIVEPSEESDFQMIYFNSDGSKATMCGNGARCAAAFCQMLGVTSGPINFVAGDGKHSALVEKKREAEWEVEVSIRDVKFPTKSGDAWYINTGTHHLVKIVDNTDNVVVNEEGPLLRNDIRYKPHGVNVNWVSISPRMIKVRTYEKGVEAETLSCGTGVTASALVAGSLTFQNVWRVETKGGVLEVSFTIEDDFFSGITLKGPAKMVFMGETSIF
ncbi:MAG: diaminopimelate epimerase [Omnitrophica WOR_2 bacterium]|jgi:diaminopimelate epimerase